MLRDLENIENFFLVSSLQSNDHRNNQHFASLICHSMNDLEEIFVRRTPYSFRVEYI